MMQKAFAKETALEALSSLPMEKVVIGIMTMEPADIMQYLLARSCEDI